MDKLNNFSCICYPGYTGRTCRDDYDDCQSSPCVHGKQNGCVSVCVSQNKKGIRKARIINSLIFFYSYWECFLQTGAIHFTYISHCNLVAYLYKFGKLEYDRLKLLKYFFQHV